MTPARDSRDSSGEETWEFPTESQVGRTRPPTWMLVGIVAASLIALVGGVLIGRSMAPEVRVETRTRTVDVERTVEVTPAICLEALDLAGEGFQYSYEAADANSEALEAVASFDVAGITAATEKIEAITDKVVDLTSRLTPAVEGCREKAA